MSHGSQVLVDGERRHPMEMDSPGGERKAGHERKRWGRGGFRMQKVLRNCTERFESDGPQKKMTGEPW